MTLSRSWLYQDHDVCTTIRHKRFKNELLHQLTSLLLRTFLAERNHQTTLKTKLWVNNKPGYFVKLVKHLNYFHVGKNDCMVWKEFKYTITIQPRFQPRTKGNRGMCGIAIFPILRDKSRFSQFFAQNRIFLDPKPDRGNSLSFFKSAGGKRFNWWSCVPNAEVSWLLPYPEIHSTALSPPF